MISSGLYSRARIVIILCLILLVLCPVCTGAATCSIPGRPKADFARITERSYNFPVVVRFQDTSEIATTSSGSQPIISWIWTFGDGTGSIAQNPVHGYAQSSSTNDWNYTVTLTVTTVCGITDTVSWTIPVRCEPPRGGFSPSSSFGTQPLAVSITDTSHNPADPAGIFSIRYVSTKGIQTGSSYDFSAGDTVHDISGDWNPTLTFTEPGNYEIQQIVGKKCSPVQIQEKQRITVFPSRIGTTSPAITTMTPAVAATETLLGQAPLPALLTSGPLPSSGSKVPVLSPASPPAPGIPQDLLPSPATPGTGTLSVITNPAGAQVFIDDVLRGLSPATIPELPAGSHTVRFEKAGYRNLTVPVSIGDGRTTVYSTALETEPAGKGILPLGTSAAVLAVAGAGAFFLMKKGKAP